MNKIAFFTFIIVALFLNACSAQTPTSTQPQNYPAPDQIGSIPEADTQSSADTSAYPAPDEQIIPDTSEGESYPAPPDGIEVFKIIPGESEVTYEVGEVFLNQDNRFNIAVGITPEVNGEVFIDRNNPQNSSIGPISVDISQFKSDSSRRDSAIRDRWLESAKFPTAIFTPQEIVGLPESYQEGDPIEFQVNGDLTIREVTLPVTFDISFIGEGDTITGEANAVILMSEFGVGPISIGGILNTEDEVKISFMFVARP